MRLVAAAVLTTLGPTLVGRRWIAGSAPMRWGLGGLVGFALLGWGAMVGGLLGGVLPGAIATLAVAWVVGPRFQTRPSRERPPRVATGVVLLIGAGLLVMSVWRPIDAWDGWAIWSMNGKALAQYDTFDNPAFLAPEYSRRFYPPLLPAWQAAAYQISGDYTRSFPTQFQLAWLWTSGALALVALGARRRWASGPLLLAWVASPVVLLQVLRGLADVPTSMFLVAGAAALFAAREDGEGSVAPAVLLGAAAATKGEGVVLVAVVLGAVALWDRALRPLMTRGAIVAGILLPWIVFAVAHGLSGYLFRDRADETLLERIPSIAGSMGAEALDFSSWGILLPAIAAVLLLSRPSPVAATAALGGVAATFLIYLLTPFRIEWLLSRSLTRVMIGPMGLLALAAATAEAKRVYARRRTGEKRPMATATT